MEDNLITLSSLSEYCYCKRRYYLMELEKQYIDNIYTTEGTIQHKEVHTSNIEDYGNFVKLTNLQVYSNKYNLIGKTDLIELIKNEKGTYIDFLNNQFDISLIEYKHGVVRDNEEYQVQLCGQCLCLEEMFNCNINIAYIYYINSEQRVEVSINKILRNKTINIIDEITELKNKQNLVLPIYKKRCKKCSLYDICNPNITIINNYIQNLWKE